MFVCRPALVSIFPARSKRELLTSVGGTLDLTAGCFATIAPMPCSCPGLLYRPPVRRLRSSSPLASSGVPFSSGMPYDLCASESGSAISSGPYEFTITRLNPIVMMIRTMASAPSGMALGFPFPFRARKNSAAMQTCWTYSPTKMCWIALGKKSPPTFRRQFTLHSQATVCGSYLYRRRGADRKRR